MNKEKLKEIFIEEANEIIESLNVDIINFEENPKDKEIINRLFRGVHTLKGSANSFGFNRLGEFVHHFEDILDYFRSSNDEISSEEIDTFLEAVDITKEVLEKEIQKDTKTPENYGTCLSHIQKILSEKQIGTEQEESSEEYSGNEEQFLELRQGEHLIEIKLKFESDIFFRGYDHGTFFKLLSEMGRIIDSYWDVSDVPDLKTIDMHKCYIPEITIFLASKKAKEEIEEIFEFVEENEYEVLVLDDMRKDHKQCSLEEGDENRSTEEPETAKKEERSFVKVDTFKLDELFDSIGELVIAQNFISENEKIRDLEDEGVKKTIETLSKITKLVQNRVMSLRMVPIKDTFEKMKRVVRDTSKKVGKEIVFEIDGEETEIDKTMIDKLSDPLIHLVRNSIDHGIESRREDREQIGKSAEGNITLRAYHKGGSIAIEVIDDGKGIEKDKILQRAIEREVAKEDEEYSDHDIYGFLMQPGFSTAERVTDISGRGVGLDVVKASIESLHGKIEIESQIGEGSVFRILLPLTLAIIDGMIVESSKNTFIIPTLSIIESFRATEDILHTAQGKGEFVNLREEILPIVRLNNLLEIDDERPPLTEGTLVCVESESKRYAIYVDELVGRQQVVIKSLGKALAKLKEISGGAVMGNGEVALILDIDGIQ